MKKVEKYKTNVADFAGAIGRRCHLVPSVGVSYSSGTEWDVYRERLYRFIAEEMIWHVPAYTA